MGATPAAAPTIGFCQLPNGPTVAFAEVGEGPPLVMVPGWLSHVEKLWAHPAAAQARDRLAAGHRFIWYDRLGCGLSDRDGFTPSLDNDVEQLEAVLDAADVERASLIGYSMGGPAAAAFAAQHPGRVERLVLYSTYARGAALTSDRQHESMKALIHANWAMGALALAAIFLPHATRRDLNWFSRFQRDSSTAEMAALLLDSVRTHDVRRVLAAVPVPTLVLTNRYDSACHPDNSREVAALVPGAVLHLLDGNGHDPFIRDSVDVADTIVNFLAGRPLTDPPDAAVAPPCVALTPRETQVLRLLAEGKPNKAIGSQLGIAPATVERHVGSIYRKTGARGRADAALYAVGLGLVPVPGR